MIRWNIVWFTAEHSRMCVMSVSQGIIWTRLLFCVNEIRMGNAQYQWKSKICVKCARTSKGGEKNSLNIHTNNMLNCFLHLLIITVLHWIIEVEIAWNLSFPIVKPPLSLRMERKHAWNVTLTFEQSIAGKNALLLYLILIVKPLGILRENVMNVKLDIC